MLKTSGLLHPDDRQDELKQVDVYKSHSKFMKTKVELLCMPPRATLQWVTCDARFRFIGWVQTLHVACLHRVEGTSARLSAAPFGCCMENKHLMLLNLIFLIFSCFFLFLCRACAPSWLCDGQALCLPTYLWWLTVQRESAQFLSAYSAPCLVTVRLEDEERVLVLFFVFFSIGSQARLAHSDSSSGRMRLNRGILYRSHVKKCSLLFQGECP